MFSNFQAYRAIYRYFQSFPKALLTLTSLKGLLGFDEKDMQNQNGILTLTSLNDLLGSDKQDRQNKNGILTLTSLNGLLGSD